MAPPKTFDDSQPQSRSSISRSSIRHYQSSPTISSPHSTEISRFNLQNLQNSSRRYIPRRHRFIPSTYATSYNNNNNNNNNMYSYNEHIITSRRSSSRYSFASNGSDTTTTQSSGENPVSPSQFVTTIPNSSLLSSSSSSSSSSSLSTHPSSSQAILPFSFNTLSQPPSTINATYGRSSTGDTSGFNFHFSNQASLYYPITPASYYYSWFPIIPSQNVAMLQTQFSTLPHPSDYLYQQHQQHQRQDVQLPPPPQTPQLVPSIPSRTQQLERHVNTPELHDTEKKKKRFQKYKNKIKHQQQEEKIPSELYLFNFFVSICEHVNAEYFIRAWSRNDKCCAILRVPILKRTFGAFKPTKDLAKELVAEMAIEEFIKQQPDAACAVAKSRGIIVNSQIKILNAVIVEEEPTTATDKISESNEGNNGDEEGSDESTNENKSDETTDKISELNEGNNGDEEGSDESTNKNETTDNISESNEGNNSDEECSDESTNKSRSDEISFNTPTTSASSYDEDLNEDLNEDDERNLDDEGDDGSSSNSEALSDTISR